MYKKIIINLAMAMISPLALASELNLSDETAATLAAADSSFYLETSAVTNLTVFHRDVTGNMSASTQLKVPANSILAVNLTSFSFKADANWVCGIRIVDVDDEDLRESNAIDESEFCMRTADVKKVILLESSNGKNKEAFQKYQQSGQLAELHDLGFMVKNTQQLSFQTFQAAATTSKMISPLKNCSLGCLTVTSEYGMRRHPVLKTNRLHKGIDLRAQTGEPVVTVADGKVLALRTERDKKTGKMKGYGNYVIIIHPQLQIETLYAHLSAFKTKAGTGVSQGQLIALSGNTGIGTAPHLHFEIHKRQNSSYVPVNPRTYVAKLLNVNL